MQPVCGCSCPGFCCCYLREKKLCCAAALNFKLGRRHFFTFPANHGRFLHAHLHNVSSSSSAAEVHSNPYDSSIDSMRHSVSKSDCSKWVKVTRNVVAVVVFVTLYKGCVFVKYINIYYSSASACVYVCARTYFMTHTSSSL